MFKVESGATAFAFLLMPCLLLALARETGVTSARFLYSKLQACTVFAEDFRVTTIIDTRV